MDQDFERSRREMETRNESLASLIAGLILLGALFNQTVVIWLNLIVERPPITLYWMELIGGAGGLMAFAVLRAKPPYQWCRKYAFSLVNVRLMSGLIMAFRSFQ